MGIFQKSEKGVFIEFDKIFKKDISCLNEFHLTKKKLYWNLRDRIIETNNEIMDCDSDDEFKLNYLVMKYRVNKRVYEGENCDEVFLEDLYKFIMTPKLIDTVIRLVDNGYISHIKEANNNRYNKGLEFTDEHCKILYRISYSMRYLIPIILEYVFFYPQVRKYLSDFLIQSFEPLFEIFAPDINIVNKIIESVKSRVLSTKYSDKVIWRYYEILGYNIEHLTYILVKKIIHDIIPKYKFSMSLVSFNHVVVYKNIDFFFQHNFPVSYKSIDISREGDGLSDFDKLMIRTAKVNESDTICREVNIELTIKHLLKRYKLSIDDGEFKYFCKHNKVNKLQKSLLFLYFAKQFGGLDTLYACNLYNYTKLLIIMKRVLEKSNYKILPRIMTSEILNMTEKRILNKKNIMKIVENKTYKDLIETKYKFGLSNIISSDNIVKLISTIINNKFLDNDYTSEDKSVRIDFETTELIDEVLNFVNTI